ncbi:MAG TPA: alpha/beta hydrolase [Pedobacter sp.]|uniref:alpha/beta hydrolase n=1 Tax=Pedobacter sp. TaxID=1411316 RepID=UPI002CC548DA|nr:alpha/beta hydrolase [Pedobacter sp.]HMI05373.1 alpha/beta hydrolase [Pedobacter sp.]
MKQALFNLVIFFMPFFAADVAAQQRFPLYPEGKIPNSRAFKDTEEHKADALVDSLAFNVSVPTLTVFIPKNTAVNGTAVIICPGGGYHVLLTKREGSDAAMAFNKLGITAFVLKYRLPSDKTMEDKTTGPLQDVQQAVKLVRENAKKWGLNPGKIGIMGYSAGGHLASLAGTHFSDPKIENKESTSLRPDFMLLINPVISFTDRIGHKGSRDNYLGPGPSQDKISYFSSELQVSKETPPAFLVHSDADQVVPVANSLEFYLALKSKDVPAGLHIYAKGEHGFLTAPSFEEWFGRCVYWMRSMSFL